MPRKRPSNVSRRADGRWVARKVFTSEESGTVHRKAFYGNSAAEASAKLSEFERQLEDGLCADSVSLSYEQWLSVWLLEYKRNSVKPTTYDSYEYLINSRIIPALGRYKINDLRVNILQGFINSLRKENGVTMAMQSVKKIKTILNVSLKQALKNGLIARNPVAALSLPSNGSAKKVGSFTMREQSMLLTRLADNRLYSLFVVALGTGMRIGELCALQWKDIDFTQNIITVTASVTRSKDRCAVTGQVLGSSIKTSTTKTRAGKRAIPMTSQVAQALKEHSRKSDLVFDDDACAEQNAEKLVFANTKGNYLEYKTVTRLFVKVRDMLGISKHSFHSLRHSFATNAISVGVDYFYLSRIMGHTSISITLDIYADYMPDKSRAEMEKMDAILPLFCTN